MKKLLDLFKTKQVSLSDVLLYIEGQGMCPCLLNDDFFHWALVFDGYQDVSDDVPCDIQTSFFVEKRYWKNTIDEAVIYSLEELLNEE